MKYVALVGRKISQKEQEELDWIAKEGQAFFAQKRKEKAEQLAKATEAKDKADAELKAKVEAETKERLRLAEVGKRCEQNHKKEKKK